MGFLDQPARVTRFKVVHAVWRRQRMEMLPGVAPVSLLLARTENTVVGLTHVRGYPGGFVFLLWVRWGHVADPYAEVPWLGEPGSLRSRAAGRCWRHGHHDGTVPVQGALDRGRAIQ